MLLGKEGVKEEEGESMMMAVVGVGVGVGEAGEPKEQVEMQASQERTLHDHQWALRRTGTI
jgi:hypothetical protein